MPMAPPWANREMVSVVPSGRVIVVVFDVGGLLDALRPSLRRGCLGAGLGGGDAVDRQEPEVAEEGLVVDAAEGGVVDDALGAGARGCESAEAVHGGGGFAAGGGDPVDVEDDAAVDVLGADGDEDALGAPGGLAGAFEVQAGVGFGAGRPELAGRLGRAVRSPGWARNSGVMTLPSA